MERPKNRNRANGAQRPVKEPKIFGPDQKRKDRSDSSVVGMGDHMPSFIALSSSNAARINWHGSAI